MRASLACGLAATAGLFIITSAGCGEVKSACGAGEDDNVPCTIDICNPDTGAWAHVPDNSGCEAGMACTVGGCVPGAGLSGHAYLLGHAKDDTGHDHSGISVSVDVTGAEMPLTTTTAADGAWTLAAPAGTYSIHFHKDKYFDDTLDNVTAVPTGTTTADVTLTHYEVANPFKISNLNNVVYSADKTSMLVAGNTDFGQVEFAVPLDGSTPAVPLPSTGSYAVTSTHAVYSVNGSVYSQPLAGGAPKLLGSALGGSISVVGTPGTYTVMQKNLNGIGSVWIARTDGSIAPPTTAAFTQADANHPIASVIASDKNALVLTMNNGGTDADPAAHRIDFATNTVANLSVNASWNSFYGVYPSPHNTAVAFYGYWNGGGTYYYRGGVLPVTSANLNATITEPPPPTNFVDYMCGPNGWFSDDSGFFYYDCYTGDLKVWHVGNNTSTLVAAAGNFSAERVVGPYLVWVDAAHNVRITNGNGGNATIDSSASGYRDIRFEENGTDVYVVTMIPSAFNGSNTNKIVASTVLASPFGATTVQLGSTLPSGCAFEGALSKGTFYALCSDTGTLTYYTKGTPAAAGQVAGVTAGLLAMPSIDRIGYTKSDGNFYSAANSAPSTSVLVSKIPNIVTGGGATNVGKWIEYRDNEALVVRMSNVDGSVIDEPMFACSLNVTPVFDATAMNMWAPALGCVLDIKTAHVPVANLP